MASFPKRPVVYCKNALPTEEEIAAAPEFARWVNGHLFEEDQLEQAALDGAEVYTDSAKIRRAYEAQGVVVRTLGVVAAPPPTRRRRGAKAKATPVRKKKVATKEVEVPAVEGD